MCGFAYRKPTLGCRLAGLMSHLPILKRPKTAVKLSRASAWRAGCLIAIHLLIAAHITHWLASGRTVAPLEPSEAMAFSKTGVINAGLIFFAASILLTLVFGRFFCGWACHLIALQDLCRSWLLRLGIRPRPLRSRVLAWVPAIAFFYMFLWPLVQRWQLELGFSQSGYELTTEQFWSTFPGWAIGILTLAISGPAAVYFLGARGFCTYACPYGAVYSAADRLTPMRVRVTDDCAGCGHCTAVCSSNVRVHEEVRAFGMVVDSGCMKSLDCVSVCPNDALYYGFGAPSLFAKVRAEPRERAPRFTRSEELVLALLFAAAFFSLRGLYGTIPFLLALGIAGVLAVLGLTGWQLVSRPNVSLRGRSLKRLGKLQRAGKLFLLFGALGGSFWIHCATIQTLQFLGERSYRETVAARQDSLTLNEDRRRLTTEEEEAASAARDLLTRSLDWGLLPTPGIARKVAWASFLVGPLEHLQNYAELALARNEAPAEMHEILARDAWARGEGVQAREEYRRAIEASPSQTGLYVNFGLVIAYQGDLERAASIFADAAARFSDSVDILYNAGVVEALRGRSDMAVAWFERALAIDETRLDARENLAGMLAATGRFEDSIKQYHRALEIAPEDLETRSRLVRVLVAASRWQEAEDEIFRITERSPSFSYLPALRAALLNSQERSPSTQRP